jgi:FkbM family methyltransferase
VEKKLKKGWVQMKMFFKKLLRMNDLFSNQVMYSQFGEDLFLKNFFLNKKNGFYVDVGAFHPKLFSNTAYLYQQGWHGINIEPFKQNYDLFLRHRKRDINLNVGVGSKNCQKEFYVNASPSFSEYATNTFVKKYKKENSVSKLVNVFTLETILNCFEIEQEIDFFDIDVEGLDLEVLKSNNWKKYRPKLVLVESDKAKNIDNFMEEKKYSKISQYYLTSIFVRNDLKGVKK